MVFDLGHTSLSFCLFGPGGHCKATTFGVVNCDETPSVQLSVARTDFVVCDLGSTKSVEAPLVFPGKHRHAAKAGCD